MSKLIQSRIPTDLHDALRAEAGARGITLSTLVREIIRGHLADTESVAGWREVARKTRTSSARTYLATVEIVRLITKDNPAVVAAFRRAVDDQVKAYMDKMEKSK